MKNKEDFMDYLKRNKLIISDTEYEEYNNGKNGINIFYKNVYDKNYDNPIGYINDIYNTQINRYCKDKNLLTITTQVLNIIYPILIKENSWKHYFQTIKTFIYSDSFRNDLDLKSQYYFYCNFYSAPFGFNFEKNFISENDLETNERWDKDWDIDAFYEDEDNFYVYQIKNFTIDWCKYNDMLIEKVLLWKETFNINKTLHLWKVFNDGKVKLI